MLGGKMVNYSGPNGGDYLEIYFLYFYYAVTHIEWLLALLENGFIIYVFFRQRLLTKISRHLLLHLAVADILSVVTSPASLTLFLTFETDHTQQWWFSLCLAKEFITYLGAAVNVEMICVIAFDRALKVIYPLKYMSWATHRRMRVVLLFIWLLATLTCGTATGMAAEPLIQLQKGVGDYCLMANILPQSVLICFASLFGIYTLLTCTLYLMFYRGLRSIGKETDNFDSDSSSEKVSGSNSRISSSSMQSVMAQSIRRKQRFENDWTHTMQLVLGCYFVCYLPNMILALLRPAIPEQIFDYIVSFTMAIWFLKPVLNPLIYARRVPQVKHALVRIRRSCCRKTPQGQVSNQVKTPARLKVISDAKLPDAKTVDHSPSWLSSYTPQFSSLSSISSPSP